MENRTPTEYTYRGEPVILVDRSIFDGSHYYLAWCEAGGSRRGWYVDERDGWEGGNGTRATTKEKIMAIVAKFSDPLDPNILAEREATRQAEMKAYGWED